MQVELVIRYMGYGKSCSHCGRVRETTRYVLRSSKTEKILQEFLLCDACQDGGYVIKFNPQFAGVKDAMRARRVQTSRKLEANLAVDMGGKVQPGSGNQDAKADVRVIGDWRLEHKFTESVKGYHLLVRDLSAVIKHANMVGEWPSMIIDFRTIGRKFAVLPYELFVEIVGRLRGKR